jgi:probable F420-dependent oxidoreductase
VVLDTDAERARALGRGHLSYYLQLPNYVNNLYRLGFDQSDVDDGGSDRLIDALVAWGDEAAIRARLDEHRSAGADHVCIQVLSEATLPLDEWRRLAPALTGS